MLFDINLQLYTFHLRSTHCYTVSLHMRLCQNFISTLLYIIPSQIMWAMWHETHFYLRVVPSKAIFTLAPTAIHLALMTHVLATDTPTAFGPVTSSNAVYAQAHFFSRLDKLVPTNVGSRHHHQLTCRKVVNLGPASTLPSIPSPNPWWNQE